MFKYIYNLNTFLIIMKWKFNFHNNLKKKVNGLKSVDRVEIGYLQLIIILFYFMPKWYNKWTVSNSLKIIIYLNLFHLTTIL